jgi:aspartate/tyrosine/aromatic aminotransferase
MTYSQINDVGKQWIRKYSLALAKELLGAIREKYSTVPIPGSEVSLDGAALRAEAQTEKDQLVEQLRENLQEVSNKVRYETEAENAENQQKLMNKVPINIYIG